MVPQLTIGHPWTRPSPSPRTGGTPPITTGMPGRRPARHPAPPSVARRRCRTPTTLGNLPRRGRPARARRCRRSRRDRSRGERGVGDDLVGHAVDHEVAGGEDQVGRLRPPARSRPARPTSPRPRRRRGDPGAGPVHVVPAHALGQPAGSAAPRRSDHRIPLPMGSPCLVDRHEGLPRPEQPDDVDRAEARPAPGRGPRRRRSPSWSTTAAGPARSSRPSGASWPARSGPRDEAVVVPQSHLGDRRPEVDRQDPLRAPTRRPGRPSPPGRGPGRPCDPWPCRLPPPAMTSRPRRGPGPGRPGAERSAEEEDGDADTGHDPRHGTPSLRPGATAGHRDLDHGRAHVVRDHRRQHDGVGIAATRRRATATARRVPRGPAARAARAPGRAAPARRR